MTSDGKKFLVVGGTGKTGRRVAERLRERHLPVRIASRGAELPFEWSDRSTWAPVLEDVDALYLTYYPDLVVPGAAEDIEAFSSLAVEQGARRLVLLSGRGEEEAEACEEIVRRAGTGWTILRCSWFAQNFSEHFLLEAVLSGELYELTGPRLLTFADAAKEIAAASGRDVRYVPVSAEEYAAAAVGFGVPEEEVAALTELFARVLDGRNSSVSDDVERVLGRKATDFSVFARDAAASGVWQR